MAVRRKATRPSKFGGDEVLKKKQVITMLGAEIEKRIREDEANLDGFQQLRINTFSIALPRRVEGSEHYRTGTFYSGDIFTFTGAIRPSMSGEAIYTFAHKGRDGAFVHVEIAAGKLTEAFGANVFEQAFKAHLGETFEEMVAQELANSSPAVVVEPEIIKPPKSPTWGAWA